MMAKADSEQSKTIRTAQWRGAMIGTSAVAGVFTLAVFSVLAFTWFLNLTQDPTDTQQVLSLERVLKEHPADETVRQEYRKLDTKIRGNYFMRQWILDTGAWLLTIGAGVFLVTAMIAGELGRKLPMPGGEGDADRETKASGRRAVAFGLILLVGAAVVLVWAARGNMHSDALAALSDDTLGRPDAKSRTDGQGPVTNNGGNGQTATNPEGNDQVEPKDPKPQEPAYASPAEMRKNWPAFRGYNNSGVCYFENIPTEWSEPDKKNIAWKVPVALPGLSSPVVWEDKIFLTGATRQKREVYCYSVKDGKLLWTGTYKSNPDAPEDYPVYESVEDMIHAAPTPVVDGKHVYAFFANGEVVCFDLEGKFVWSTYVASPEGNSYGNSASLLKYRDKVIVLHDGQVTGLYALDGLTGKQLWMRERQGFTWASPILIRTAKGSEQVAVSSNPVLEAYDANSGKPLWATEYFYGDVAPSPIFAANKVIAAFKGSGMLAVDPDEKGKMLWESYELEEAEFPETTSPVADDKYVYFYEGGMLVCSDLESGETVYEEYVGEDASYASPTIVGDKLMIFCYNKTLVVQTGKEYKLIRTNALDGQEVIHASPAFLPGKVFIRGSKNLYCIQAKGE